MNLDKFELSEVFIFFIAISVFFIYGCNKTGETENKAPICTITSPVNGEEIQQGGIITISVDADDSDGNISEVKFEIDHIEVGSVNSSPFNFSWNTAGIEKGSHTIKAIANDNDGCSSSYEIVITLTEGGGNENLPDAAFTAYQTIIGSGYSLQFNDHSTNSPTMWFWSFGDGSHSTSQNPLHTYSTLGKYTVTLTVANSYGSDSVAKSDYITVVSIGVQSGSVADYDGNIYKTVKIGSQWWMAKNLETLHYADGTAIPNVESNQSWENLSYSDKAYCYYENSLIYANDFGVLYTWAAAMNGAVTSDFNPSGVQGVCPDGWHLPSDSEWIQLEMYLGMSQSEAFAFGWRGTNEGDQLKATSGWYNDGNGNNSSGFNALPGGTRLNNGPFNGMGEFTRFWSTTEYINITFCAFNRSLSYLYSGVGFLQGAHYYGYPKDFGLSVRCVSTQESQELY